MENKIAFLKEITDLNGVPGNEKEVKHYMANKFKLINRDVEYDGLGSVISKLVGDANGPVIMCSGHMDEVGFMVNTITEGGFLTVIPLGGWNPLVISAQQVTITNSKGEKFHGVVGSIPPHGASALKIDDRNKFFEDVFIDIGCTSKEEVMSLGIKRGNMITPYTEFKVMGKDKKHLMAKAWDCRIGCAMVIEIMEKLKKEGHPNIYAAVGSTQEEVGCRGAMTSSYLVQPQIGFSFDVSLAKDFPKGGDKEGYELGKGPQIHIFDAGTIGNKALFEFVCDVAEENKIPYQITVLKGGGTDASKISTTKIGAPALSIGIPSRYIHSHTSMIHYDDYVNGIKLMTEVIKRLDSDTVKKIWEE